MKKAQIFLMQNWREKQFVPATLNVLCAIKFKYKLCAVITVNQ